jgi:TetR/AcrR family transcriptional regulator, acrAB operon repressor
MRRTKEAAAQTRAAIVEAGLACFDRHGIAGTTLYDIAAEAGVTKGAVYHHFKGKRAILHELREQFALPLLDAADTAMLRGDDLPALERIERFVVGVIDELERDPRKCRVLSVMLFKCEYVGDLAEELAGALRNSLRLIKSFEAAYCAARDEGRLADGMEPEIAALETMLFFSGLMRLWLLHGPRSALRRNARAAVAAHVRSRGVTAPRPARYGAFASSPRQS